MKNILINGDAYNLLDTLSDNSIDLVYIDPPYLFSNMNKEDTIHDKTKLDERDYLYQINEISNGFDYSILDKLCRVLKRIYIYMV